MFVRLVVGTWQVQQKVDQQVRVFCSVHGEWIESNGGKKYSMGILHKLISDTNRTCWPVFFPVF